VFLWVVIPRELIGEETFSTTDRIDHISIGWVCETCFTADGGECTHLLYRITRDLAHISQSRIISPAVQENHFSVASES
jgi:hypothetical protein